jgi:hypothetical protein
VRGRLDGLLQGNTSGWCPGRQRAGGGEDLPARRRRAPDGLGRHRPHDPAARASDGGGPGVETWVVMDLSPSLDFGRPPARSATSPSPPRGRHAPDAGRVATGSGVGQHGRADGPDPGRGGHRARAGDAAQGGPDPAGPDRHPGDLRPRVRSCAGRAPAAGWAVVISDFLGEPDWERALRALSARHELLAIEVLDPRELELPEVGTVGAGRPGDRPAGARWLTTPLLCREFAAAARGAPRAGWRRRWRHAGAAHLTLRTTPTGSPTSCGSPSRASGPGPGEGGSGGVRQPWWLLLLLVAARWRSGTCSCCAGAGATRSRSRTWSCSTGSLRTDRAGLRHLPAVALILALTLLTIALAGPTPRRGCRATGPRWCWSSTCRCRCRPRTSSRPGSRPRRRRRSRSPTS